jgi:hypothetical protein
MIQKVISLPSHLWETGDANQLGSILKYKDVSSSIVVIEHWKVKVVAIYTIKRGRLTMAKRVIETITHDMKQKLIKTPVYSSDHCIKT